MLERPWTRLALLAALFGIVTGNLLRPCDCAREVRAGATPRCCTAKLAKRTPDAACPSCCCHGATRSTSRSEPRPQDGDRAPEGCTICCKPRPPMDESQGTVEVPARALSAALFVPPIPEAWTLLELEADAHARPAPRRTIDPWLLTPEGLAVFLI